MDELSVLRAIAALLVVLGLLGGLWFGLRRFSNMMPGLQDAADLKVVSWRPLDGKRRLAIIRWGEEEHLVITGPQGDTHISTRQATTPTETAESEQT